MGLYTVLRPCMVGDLHYAQVPAEPIVVDDTVAAALVKSGDLAPVAPVAAVEQAEPKAEPQPHRRRTTKA